MAHIPSFDDFNEDSPQENGYKPFQFRDEKGSKEKTLQWLNDNFDYCYMKSRDRLMSYRRFANRYKNLPDYDSGGLVREAHRDLGTTLNRPKVRTNFFYDYTEKKVAGLAKMKLNLKFIPHNDNEQDDINDAEACQTLVDFRLKQLKFNDLMTEMDRMTFKYGHSFAKIYWDCSAGPIHPKYKKALDKYGKVEEIDDGKPTGKKLNSIQARIGDVGIKVLEAGALFPERKKRRWVDVDYVDEIEFVNIDLLKAEHPRADIKKEEYNWLDIENRGYNGEDMICVHHFYHRPTKYLPTGVYIKYVESDILEWCEEEEEILEMMPDGELPFVEDRDIEVDDDFWARPYFVNLEQLNNMHDLIQSGIARNIGVASHPKLLIAEGSVNLKQANNEYGVMQWRGPAKPEWLQHNYVNRGEFEIQDRLEKKMDSLSKVFEISKGQVPAGITAASALRLLDDQESTANFVTTEKKRTRVKSISWKVALLMNANYEDDDERMVTILGDNNEYLIASFKEKPAFAKMASVEMEYISALSDTRAGRVADIIDLNAANQKDPTFGRKEIIKLLDLGLEDAFKEEVNYSAVTARTMLENLKKGKEALPPTKADDLVEMYHVFSRFVESLNYKVKLKPATRTAVNDYIHGLEYLMTEQALKNALFASRVRAFDKFPIFYEPGGAVVAPQPQAQQPMQGGADQSFKGLSEKTQTQMTEENNGGM